jgi:hypothetical protein
MEPWQGVLVGFGSAVCWLPWLRSWLASPTVVRPTERQLYNQTDALMKEVLAGVIDELQTGRTKIDQIQDAFRVNVTVERLDR